MMVELNKIYHADCYDFLKKMDDESIDCIVTSPPYWGLRDYNVDEQLGLETNFNDFINRLCNIFDEGKRILKKEGSCFVIMGDTYAGNSSYCSTGRQGFNGKDGNIVKWASDKLPQQQRSRDIVDTSLIPNKSLCMIPQRFAIEMINRDWILRNVIIWHKPSCLPSSVKDRFTVDFEYLYFFTKHQKYFFEQQFELIGYESLKRQRRGANENKNSHIQTISAPRGNKGYVDIDEEWNNHQGRNKRAVWSISNIGFSGDHFATYPEKLIETPIRAGSPEGGIILDPFMGSGTTGVMAAKLNRDFIGIDINEDYVKMATERIQPYLEQGKLF